MNLVPPQGSCEGERKVNASVADDEDARFLPQEPEDRGQDRQQKTSKKDCPDEVARAWLKAPSKYRGKYKKDQQTRQKANKSDKHAAAITKGYLRPCADRSRISACCGHHAIPKVSGLDHSEESGKNWDVLFNTRFICTHGQRLATVPQNTIHSGAGGAKTVSEYGERTCSRW